MMNPFGIYEKALPATFTWAERLRAARNLGFDFVEISIDESEARLARLASPAASAAKLLAARDEEGISIPSMCLSGHRKFPMGSRNAAVRERAMDIMNRAIELASLAGIRVIQLAGYDVYYETPGDDTQAIFLDSLGHALEMAAAAQVMLAIETMDTERIHTVGEFSWFRAHHVSPWLGIYPDAGNLTAWNLDVESELEMATPWMVGLHLKDTRPVAPGYSGQFRDVPFGAGSVDFVNIFHTLSRLNYRGPLLLEMWSGNSPDALDQVSAARAFMLEQMRRAGWSRPGDAGQFLSGQISSAPGVCRLAV